jgi:hypothetical protein
MLDRMRAGGDTSSGAASGGRALPAFANVPIRDTDEVLRRFTQAERTETVRVRAHERPNLAWIRPGVLTQCPSDRFANEELPIGKVWFDAVIEELDVRPLLAGQLTEDDRRPSAQ